MSGNGCSWWPTLRANECGSYQRDGGQMGKERATLTGKVKGWTPTLAARDYRHPNRPDGASRKKRKASSGDQLPNAIGGPLNPTWCEWYMGFPAGWTELGDSGTR